ncbi:MAG: hypothetical protein AAFZ91_15670 [Pseudomonadota bacterium]
MAIQAYGGKARQVAAKGGMGIDSEPVRARLKLMHQEAHKSLSAHLFFGTLCREMWCTHLIGITEFIAFFWCMTARLSHGG